LLRRKEEYFMAELIVMPRQGNTVESCLIVEWKKNEGDEVAVGDPLCTVETDKAAIDVEAETAGTLLKILRQVDDDVPVLDPIAVIGTAGEDVSSLIGDATEKPSPPESSSPEPATAPPAAVTSPAAPTSGEPKKTGTTGAVSPRARNLAASKGVDPLSIQGTGSAGRVIERDVMAFLGDKAPATPAARARAVTEGKNIPSSGSGIGGRVISEDLQQIPAAKSEAAVAPENTPAVFGDFPVKGIRKIIADRMQASLASTAQLTLNTSAPAESILHWRKVFKNSGEASGLSGITINDLVIFAVSRIVPMFPDLNAHFLGDTIRQFSDINVGVAVDTPRGLMVPVIHQANKKSLKEISTELRTLAQKCREGSASMEDLSGGTFTITNLGAFGIESFTPVLNAPEVAILGVSSIEPRAVMDEEETRFVPHLGLSLTIDHQAVDGAPGARFLQELCRRIAAFETVAAL
jgi:pyruvate dehydrogenase E2 component (dihydrolipoamide acetyltransferase)